MKARIEAGRIVVEAETLADRKALKQWAEDGSNHLAEISSPGGGTLIFQGAGPEPEVRREPINIVFDTTPMPFRLIANLAPTPFELDGRRYASVEGFWQGLKFPDEASRTTIAALDGHAAKSAGDAAPKSDTISYLGSQVRIGTIDHWTLMEKACRAKFAQRAEARAALLSTGTRPLVHRVKVDSRTIPGVIMADIWTRIRTDLSESPAA